MSSVQSEVAHIGTLLVDFTVSSVQSEVAHIGTLLVDFTE